MFDAMSWLVKDAKINDSLFFHCNPRCIHILPVRPLIITSIDSGHGGQVKDETGREADGMDEGIAAPPMYHVSSC